MQQDKRKVFFSIIVGLLSLNGLLFSTAQATDIEKSRDLLAERPPGMTCYSPRPPAYYSVPEYQELRKDAINLEKLYKEGKINKETYNIRINKIKEQMHKLEQEYKDRENKG